MISDASTALFLASGVGSSPGLDNPAAMAKGPMSAAQIDKTASDFESMFVSEMLGEMFGDSIGDAAYGNSESSDIYKSMMMDAYGKEIVKSGGIGIADYVRKELLKLQEAA